MSNTLKISEYAEDRQVSESTVRRLLKAGDIPFLRCGGSIRIPKAWADEQLQSATDEWRTAHGEAQ